MQNSSNIYFRQLLSGRDFAVGNRAAEQMVNFVYLLGDKETGECVVIDPAYAVDDIIAVADTDGMKISGVLATHYHADNIGGSIMGLRIEGIAKMLESASIPIHVNAHESEFVLKTTGITKADLVEHRGGDTLAVGNMEVTFIHTPGHTPG
ncbi:MAG: MBL fold metallo-hydrolase, partial [Actinobacteria bacterium]|nr:MBL fold metallo-hydrolase [Actinomycetota bacterium]